jgi:hypothetical protein
MFFETARMNLRIADNNIAGMKFQFFSSSISPHMPFLQS